MHHFMCMYAKDTNELGCSVHFSKKTGILKFFDLVILHICLYMFKLLPTVFDILMTHDSVMVTSLTFGIVFFVFVPTCFNPPSLKHWQERFCY